ncbi:MAG: alkaline phosphatase family protein, partial [bacterium]
NEHVEGRNSPILKDVMERIDGHIREIISATRATGIYDRTTFIIVGDHGSSEVQTSLAPNMLLEREGLLQERSGQIESWEAIVQNTGGSAAVYLRDRNDAAALRRIYTVFEKHRLDASGKPMYSLIDRSALARLGGPADAAFYLEGEPGIMFSGSIGTGNWSRRANLRGNHGYLPTKPEMFTGFIAFGRGIRQGVVLDTIRVTDVAPTIAALLGFPFESTQSRVLREILK